MEEQHVSVNLTEFKKMYNTLKSAPPRFTKLITVNSHTFLCTENSLYPQRVHEKTPKVIMDFLINEEKWPIDKIKMVRNSVERLSLDA